MGLFSVPLSHDEYSLVYTNHFPVRFQKGGAKTQTDYSLMLGFGCLAFFCCLFALGACLLPWLFAVLCFAILFCIIFHRLLTLVVFAAAVILGQYTKKFYRSSVIWFGWWPFWLCVVSVLAAAVGYLTGKYLWSDFLGPYYEYKRLQMYRGINPNVIPGERIQDSGLVDFTSNAQIDRSKGGCFMDRGDTYCIAPIVDGGVVQYDLQGIPRTGSYDYFAVGINCCSCPNHDFQCGEWKNPFARGGMRSLDYKARPFYKLALGDWEAAYQKASKQPLFFDWVEQPEYVWKKMWNQTLYVSIYALAFALAIGITIGLVVDKMLQLLWYNEIVVPRACIAPAPGMTLITAALLPRMYADYQDEQMSIACMPVSAEWKPLEDPNGKDEQRKRFGYAATQEARNELEADVVQSIMAPPGADSTGFDAMSAYSTARLH